MNADPEAGENGAAIDPVDLEAGDKITAWVTSNTTDLTEISGAVLDVRLWGGDAERVMIESADGTTYRVYYPNAHLEDLSDGVRSVGRVTDWFVRDGQGGSDR